MMIETMNKIEIKEYSGEGLFRVIESGEWFVGIKNYKPMNDPENVELVERHLESDEVFVLLEGKCTLFLDFSDNNQCNDFRCIPMEKNKVYCINKGVWHNMAVSKDVKLILVENRNTCGDNSEIFKLSESQISDIKANL